MKNKIELKKMYIISTIVILIFLMVISLIIYNQYKEYTYNFNQRIASIVTKITEEYPKVNKEDIIEILNQDENENNAILREYGIDLEKDSAILENEQKFKKFIIVDIIVISIFIVTIEIIFLIYNHQKEKKIQEITKYLEEINRGNYKLDIEDNTEDELSILKNELCKTTVMLNEVAENSRKDKINLKNSLSDISHQLKTPLANVMMYRELLEGEDSTAGQKKMFLSKMELQLEKIDWILRSLFKMVGLEQGAIIFESAPSSLRKTLLSAVNAVYEKAEKKNIEIITEPFEDCTLYHNDKWTAEVFVNILENAVKYTETAGKIYIRICPMELFTEIQIEDNGIGIRETELADIFKRFYRSKDVEKKEGSGIGLYLSRLILEKEKGYMTVKSVYGKGSCFSVFLQNCQN